MVYPVSQEHRWIQKIVAITFSIAKKLSANIITRKWVA